jgi:hypothetical protein
MRRPSTKAAMLLVTTMSGAYAAIPKMTRRGGRPRATNVSVSGLKVPEDIPAMICRTSITADVEEKDIRKDVTVKIAPETSNTRRGPSSVARKPKNGPMNVVAIFGAVAIHASRIHAGASRPLYPNFHGNAFSKQEQSAREFCWNRITSSNALLPTRRPGPGSL